MYRILIGDDDSIFIEEAFRRIIEIMDENHLIKDKDYEIEKFTDPQSLLDDLNRNREVNLLLLDVEFGSANGLEIMKALREEAFSGSVIYLTNYRDYIYECFDTKPLYYLLKPIDWSKLCEVILNHYIETCRSSRLSLKLSGKHVILAYADIYALEATSHKVCIWLKDGTLAWNGTLSAIEKNLPSHMFCRCHNSFLVNLAHIQEFDRKEVKMDNGTRFPVSKRLYAGSLRQYFTYLKN